MSWISGHRRLPNDLLNECIRDSREKGKSGLCILSSAKKRGFLADPKYLKYKGFIKADSAEPIPPSISEIRETDMSSTQQA